MKSLVSDPKKKGRFSKSLDHFRTPKILQIVLLILADGMFLLSLERFISNGFWFLIIALTVVVVGLNLIVLIERLNPLRWIAPGMALLVLMVITPIVYTVYVAFTNYNSDHLYTKQQAIKVLEMETFLDRDSVVYQWAAYQAPSGEFALWLKAPDSSGALITPGQPEKTIAPGTSIVGPLDEDGFPVSIQGYTRLNKFDAVKNIDTLSKLDFGQPPNVYKVASLDEVAQYKQKYVYDAVSDTLTDRETNTTYTEVQGTFTAKDGSRISPSFQAMTGLDNFERLFGNSAILGPFLQIFLWTIAFAVLVVLGQFVLGLIVALVFNDPDIPRPISKIIRSILLLPFVIPNYLSILVWGAMLDPDVGILTGVFHNIFGLSSDWVHDPWGAKLAVLMVAFWLGFPYFLLINSGALQAIPGEILEAGVVDGANPFQRFRSITFPLLLKTVGPLMVLSFAFNFNNFTVIYLLTGGGPPMPNVQTSAGFTDILITYTYKLAFTFGRGADYGLASVITMMIFFVLIPVVYSQFRYYQVWSEEGA